MTDHPVDLDSLRTEYRALRAPAAVDVKVRTAQAAHVPGSRTRYAPVALALAASVLAIAVVLPALRQPTPAATTLMADRGKLRLSTSLPSLSALARPSKPARPSRPTNLPTLRTPSRPAQLKRNIKTQTEKRHVQS